MVLLILLAGCSKEAHPSHSWGPLKSVLDSSTELQAFRISEPEKGNVPYPDWPVEGNPVVVDAHIAKELTALVLDPKSYSDNPKPCKPNPGIKVRWLSGASKVEIFFCFDCTELFIYSEEGRRQQREFDPSEKAFAATMKKIFPIDRTIQALK